MSRKLVGIVSAGMLFGVNVMAQSPAPKADAGSEPKAKMMKEIVVTASKSPVALTDITQSIGLVDEAELGKLQEGKGNISELLTFQPGNLVTVLSRNDANWGSYGGIGPKYSTYMLDGLPVDSFIDTQALDMWALKRIENQRGPASVLYPNYLSQDFAGNQSPLAGTVNLITQDRVTEPLSRLDAAYGAYNTTRLRAYHQDVAGPVSLFGGASYETSDYTDYGTANSWLNMIDDPEYTKLRLYGGTTIGLNDAGTHRLSLFGNWDRHKGDAGRPNRKFDHQYSLLQGAYSVPVNDEVSLQAKVGYRRYDRTWQEDNFSNGGDLSLASDDGVVQNIIPADVAMTFAHAGGGLLTLGSDLQNADYETYSDSGHKVIGNDGRSTQYGFYLQEQLLVAQWVLRAGGRLNHIAQDINLLSGALPGDSDASWTKGLWSAGARYNGLDVVSPFANIGTSFMAPGLKSVGGTLNASDRGVAGRNGQLPNSDLKPEDGLGGDVGIDVKAFKDSLLTVRSFASVIDNAIVENAVSQNPSQSQSVNAGKTTAMGAELSLDQEIAEWLTGFANYTYTHTSIDNDVDSDQDGAEVSFVPENTGNIGVTMKLPYDLTISPYLHVAGSIYDSTSKSGRRKFDGYELINVTIRKGLVRDEKRSVDLYAELYNVTNNKFEMPWQFQDPGFSAMVGVQATF